MAEVGNRKTILQYMIRYGTVMVITSVLMLILINGVLQKYRQSLIMYTKEDLTNTLQDLDIYLMKQEDVAKEIYLNKLSSPKHMLKNTLYAREGIDQIILYQKTLEINDYVLVRYQPEEIFISNGNLSLNTLTERVLKLRPDSRDVLMEAMQDHGQPRVEVIANCNEEYMLIFSYPMLSYLTKSEDVIGFIIQGESLKRYLLPIMDKFPLYAVMMGKNGELLFESNGLENITVQETEELRKQLLMGESQLPKDYSYCSYESDNGFSFYCALQNDMLLANFNKIFVKTLMFSVLILAVASVMIGYINRFHVNSIEKLRDQLLYYSGKNINLQEKNEFRQIQHLIQTICQEQKKSNVMQEQLARILFSGLIKQEEILEEFVSKSCPGLHGPYYMLLSVVVVRQGEKMVSELTGEAPFDLFIAEQYQDATVLFFVIGLSEDRREKCYEMAELFIQKAQSKGVFETFITIGRVFSQLSEVSYSYQRMLSVIYYQLSSVSTQKITFFESVIEEGRKHFYTEEDTKRLTYMLSEGNIEKVRTELYTLRNRIDDDGNETIQKFIRIVLVELLKECLEQLGTSTKQISKLQELPLENDEVFMNGIAAILKKSYVQDSVLIKSIMNFVDANYKDNSMGLEAIAFHFNISVPTASRYIKEMTGQKYSEYISKLRLEEACRLLAETNMKIQDIPFEIGYKDYVSFSKKFKLVMGVTPGKYRSEIQKNKS